MDIFESSVFKARKRHLLQNEQKALAQAIQQIQSDPKKWGQLRAEIHAEIYTHMETRIHGLSHCEIRFMVRQFLEKS